MKSSSSNKRSILNSKIFFPSLIIIGIVSALFALYTDESMALLDNIFNTIVDSFKWGYIWYAIFLVVAGFYLSFSKYGKVVLGEPGEQPRFTLFEYASLLIAMGLGATIMRTGMVQWTQVASDPPFGLEAESMEALLAANSYSMFLWTFQTFAIFVMIAPAMGYLIHVRKKPKMRISEACRVLFGDKFTDGIGGILLDILFMISILAGAAVTLGLGTPIVTYNLAELLNIEVTFPFTLAVTVIWVLLFSISAYVGIDKGIKRLSTLNMYLAGIFSVFLLLVGPGLFILDYFTDSIRYLFSNYLDFSLYTHSLDLEGGTHIESHTVFWFAYNATWAMLHGVFAAVISKGRTIQEMIMTYFLAPAVISWIATGLLGGLGVHRYLTGDVQVMDILQEQGEDALIPAILDTLPFSAIIIALFVVMATIFMVTTMDSTTYTIATYTTTRDMSKQAPPRNLRIVVAIVITVLALSLMNVGGLEPLEVLSGIMGIPIIAIQIILVYAAKKMMDQDRAWVHNVRKHD
ncbi:BCCT family transporter [Natribacillus halophilus]|uniref:BCCT, betaine/carnitine/choline family transporter n=1 Tax=Natribacillus halophilus TaxID=549003 RepID=A0A1G8PF08_9BACI|nr:BCCT family transporter [Natribacillus halophilus]SDI90916.1 BCCT, betaine/carnitine/choline family transporter [Natribacillus halophilus]